MASLEQCVHALHRLAGTLAGIDEATRRKTVLDRTLSCTIRDLGVVYAGELRGGHLEAIRQVSNPKAQIRLALDSDDLIRLVDRQLKFGRAWATGRVRVDASLRDLLRLRALV